MSCTNCQNMDYRIYHPEPQYRHPYYASTPPSPRIHSPINEVYMTGSRTGTAWIAPEFSRNTNVMDTPREGRGEPSYCDINIAGKTPCMRTLEATKYRDNISNDATTSVESIRAKMKYLEDSNVVMQTRNQNLITENENLRIQSKRDEYKAMELERRLSQLEEILSQKRGKITKECSEQTMRESSPIVQNSTSMTDLVTWSDQETQIWALCRGCQRKLEGCEKEMVTITKSELDVLEKDMRTLRDAVIIREEAWAKAMEREYTYRQQIARLTCEELASRHLCETRQHELQDATDSITQKESKIKCLQKEYTHFSKIIVKFCKQLRNIEENPGKTFDLDLNEKEQRTIEELFVQSSMQKNKQKGKSRVNSSAKSASSRVKDDVKDNSFGNKSPRHAKDQTASAHDAER